jgi:hypothetical protein
MAVQKTISESLFEEFLSAHSLPFAPVPVANTPRPDYAVGDGTPWGPLLFEIKELSEDDDFRRTPLNVSKRKVGEHIRSKIAGSKKQIQYGANQGIPSILLIYNALDTAFHMFGTEDHDFLAAMHGDWMLVMSTVTGQIVDAGYGRNRSFREGHNTSFTALGHLAPLRGALTVRLFPNEYAIVPLPMGVPKCFTIVQ